MGILKFIVVKAQSIEFIDYWIGLPTAFGNSTTPFGTLRSNEAIEETI